MQREEFPQLMGDVFTYLPQIQSLLIILITKIYNNLVNTDLFNFTQYDPDILASITNAVDIIGEFCYYILTYHGGKLKPGFKANL